MSLFHRRSKDDSPQQDAVEAPPAAPAAAAPPSPEELDATMAFTTLKHQLEDGKLTQAEFDARREQLGGSSPERASQHAKEKQQHDGDDR